jgi:Domain of unknown function (DUF1788).
VALALHGLPAFVILADLYVIAEEKLHSGLEALHNLYRVFLSICDDKRITDRVAQQEEKKGKQFVLDQMKRMANNTAFIGKMQYEPHEPGDVILITGVGEAFPFIRVHALLDAMQPYFSDVPVLVMYPGTFDGRYVKLFDKLEPNPYYRAFNVI